jgi:hypothetical protein
MWFHIETVELPLPEAKDTNGKFSGAIIYLK